jgi:hypothetical protein
MEVLNVRLARSLWLFDARDLNPHGLSPIPFFSAIKDRYHFLVWPKTPEELSWNASSAKGIKFVDGTFSVEDTFRTVAVTFFNDGIIADTGSSTRHSEAFLEDVLGFATQYFGARPRPDYIHKKQHISELIVSLSPGLGEACDKIARLATRLGALSNAPFDWFGLELRSGTKGGTQETPIFKIERELGMPAALNRYYSIAGLSTEVHAELLSEFERIIGG